MNYWLVCVQSRLATANRFVHRSGPRIWRPTTERCVRSPWERSSRASGLAMARAPSTAMLQASRQSAPPTSGPRSNHLSTESLCKLLGVFEINILNKKLICRDAAYRTLQSTLQGGPKKRTPSFIFGITSVIQHRF